MTTLALNLRIEDEVFFEEHSTVDELATFRTGLLIQLLDNTILEGALDIHRELLSRSLSEEELRSIMERHPRLTYAHNSTSYELRGEMLISEDTRARLQASPFLNRGKYCKACVVDSTSGSMR